MATKYSSIFLDFDKYLKEVLDGVVALHDEHEARCSKDISFNIFLAMRNKHDEVRLHSRFIASLLDPDAPHNLKTLPLELFLKTIGIDTSILNGKNLEVQPSYTEKSEYENIDILITTTTKAIIVENKINHHDTNHDDDYVRGSGKIKLKGQLERYYHCMVNDCNFQPKNVEVVYLTKEGKMPSETSTGGTKPKFPELRDKVRCISYGQHIYEWLTNLSAYCSKDLKAFIKQYIDIIEEMTDSTNIEERKKLVEEIGKLDNKHLDAMAYIFDNQNHICWHIADDFWHSILRNAERYNYCVECLEVNDNKQYETAQYDMCIAEGMTRAIHEQKRGYFAIYLKNKDGIVIFLSMNHDDESIQLGTINKYWCAQTRRQRTLPLNAIEWLEESGYYALSEFCHQKSVVVDNDFLDLNVLSCRNTIRIANEKEREIVVHNVLTQAKEFSDQLSLFVE